MLLTVDGTEGTGLIRQRGLKGSEYDPQEGF